MTDLAMPRPALLLPLRWLGLLIVMASSPSHAQPAIACHTEQARHDRLDVRCPWPADAPRLRFEAHFAGSHDDTTATLVATVNGTPLTCAAGSKTSIDGQDEGDVTLTCTLTAPPLARGATHVRFELRWHHARYGGFAVRVEPGG
ncbi:hypothetical protein [Piscinibacter gummiphilus]|uniref:Ig-like domain-containing protein n=1 Tax=Piscinibacter gummiphilus TaxID=946333 RepID=A0ABZ0CLZ6_9BURK|nr:hypothetical protein [Piscinibacter gummiphilus]WOB06003.1 hypothetical protein RXV79_13835 [Piscinibacter gummiphilus]